MTYPPLIKTITVPAQPEAAFRRFTTEIGSWWPTQTHSVGQQDTIGVVFEPHVGGRIYEQLKSGAESDWGMVQEWEPPRRAVFSWHPGQKPETAQTIEVVFESVAEGTRLTLTHTGWERLPLDEVKRARRGYPIGWEYVLRVYAGKRDLFVRTLDLLTPLLRRLG
jgi:uncharacterized protein YndB with AHSA1/START domain